MTHGIPYRTSSYGSPSGTRASAGSTTRPVIFGRSTRWFLETVRNLGRSIVQRHEHGVPDALIEDVGLGTRRTQSELLAELSRLDAQFHARFY